MLKIEKLVKKFGDKVVLKGIDLEIKGGEIYGFIGHNGAGKTTTIKCVAGILAFDSGEIFIDGVSVKENPIECKKRLAYIPDNPDIYNFMTGYQYLNFIADAFCVPQDIRKARIEKYAAEFELIGDLNRRVSDYSHGMKQKLVLISAFLHDPKLIILDEPFVGLDPKASFHLKEIMRQFCDNGGAIFFSTHVLDVAEKLCDRVAIIKQGEVIKSGTMEEVKGDASLESAFLESEK